MFPAPAAPPPRPAEGDGPMTLAEVLRLLAPGSGPAAAFEALIDRVEGRR